MKVKSFIKGMGIGLALGAAAGICALAPMPAKKNGSRTFAGRAIRAVGEVMNDAADNMGL